MRVLITLPFEKYDQKIVKTTENCMYVRAQITKLPLDQLHLPHPDFHCLSSYTFYIPSWENIKVDFSLKQNV